MLVEQDPRSKLKAVCSIIDEDLCLRPLDGADRIVNARKLRRVAGGVWMKCEREDVLILASTVIKNEFDPCKCTEIKRWIWGIWTWPGVTMTLLT